MMPRARLPLFTPWMGASFTGAGVYGIVLWQDLFVALDRALLTLYTEQRLFTQAFQEADLPNEMVGGVLLLLLAPLFLSNLSGMRAWLVGGSILLLTATSSLVFASWGLFWSPAALTCALLLSLFSFILLRYFLSKEDGERPGQSEILPPRSKRESQTKPGSHAPFPYP